MKTITMTGIETGELVNEMIGWADSADEQRVGIALQDAACNALGDEFYESEEPFSFTATDEDMAVINEALIDMGVAAGMQEYIDAHRTSGN